MMEAVSEHTHRMIVQATDIRGELDVFIQRRSHWVIDTMGIGGYEVLMLFADKINLLYNRSWIAYKTNVTGSSIGQFILSASDLHGAIWAWVLHSACTTT